MSEVTIRVEGMSCEGCVRNVTGVLMATAGVQDARVSLEENQAVVDYDPAEVGVAQLRQAIVDAGFDAPE